MAVSTKSPGNIEDSSTLQLLEKVQTVQERWDQLFARQKVTLPKPLPSTWKHIEELPLTKVHEILTAMIGVHRVLADAEEEGIFIHDSTEILRYSLQRFGMTCPDSFIRLIEDEDIVEAYNLAHIQIFRNLRFMETCGYSLVELLTYDWQTLFDRSSLITERMLSSIQCTLQSRAELRSFDIEPHLMREKFSSTLQLNVVQFKYISPLIDQNGNAAGAIVSCDARILNESERRALHFI